MFKFIVFVFLLFVEHFYDASSGSGYHGLAFKDSAEKYRLEPGDGKI